MATVEVGVEIEAASRRRFELICGHVTESLRAMPAESVHCAITSPPYWGLRSYGTEPQVHGGDPDCHHEWGDPERAPWANALPGPNGRKKNTEATRQRSRMTGQACVHCSAWLGELGNEPTVMLYVEHLVEVFREVRRVLRPDGSLWLNLGDSYVTGAGRVGPRPGGGERGDRWVGNRAHRASYHGKHAKMGDQMGPMTQPNRLPQPGLKPKDLAGIPWRVAFALQDDGWYLRSDCVWNKPNCLPESVTDRPSKSHEYFFLLTKRERYFYDKEAVREDLAPSSVRRGKYPHNSAFKGQFAGSPVEDRYPDGKKIERMGDTYDASGRNKRTVWTVALRSTKTKHFASFPPDLVVPCVRAGTSERGVCPTCAAPWLRVIRKRRYATRPGLDPKTDPTGLSHRDPGRHCTEVKLLGWRPSCGCYEARYLEEMPRYARLVARGGSIKRLRKRLRLYKKKYPAPDSWQTVPAVVADPFNGTATVGAVALAEGRDYLGIDLQPRYIEISQGRLQAVLDAPPPKIRKKKSRPAASEFLPLFDRRDDGPV
jgi:DNA modification methylase